MQGAHLGALHASALVRHEAPHRARQLRRVQLLLPLRLHPAGGGAWRLRLALALPQLLLQPRPHALHPRVVVVGLRHQGVPALGLMLPRRQRLRARASPPAMSMTE